MIDKNQLAEIAHRSVEGVETVEPNDRERLGYHVYLYLTGALPSVAAAVAESRSRTTLDPASVVQTITDRLQKEGSVSS